MKTNGSTEHISKETFQARQDVSSSERLIQNLPIFTDIGQH